MIFITPKWYDEHTHPFYKGFIVDFLSGVKVTCKGPPGHGSKFIEGTAAEKMVSALFECFVA